MNEQSKIGQSVNNAGAHVQGADPRNNLSAFAKQVLRDKQLARASRKPIPSGPKVYSTFVPSHPARPIKKPEGRKVTQVSNSVSGGSSVAQGAFFTKYIDDDGHTWLQGGQVKSGSGNFTIADLKVIDSGTGIVADENDILVLEVTVTGYVVDGVLLAGLTATAAAYVTPYVGTVSDDTLPTVAASTGRKVYIEIGRWSASDFHPADVGNIRIAFCPGAYQITRY